MSEEKVICSKADCRTVFTTSELVSLGSLLVIPEHRNPNTDGLCPGSFEPPREISNLNHLLDHGF